MSEYGPGVYDVLDSGSAAGAAAAAQGASMMFEYNWFEYGADYRFREFEITAVPVDITVEFRDGDTFYKAAATTTATWAWATTGSPSPRSPKRTVTPS